MTDEKKPDDVWDVESRPDFGATDPAELAARYERGRASLESARARAAAIAEQVEAARPARDDVTVASSALGLRLVQAETQIRAAPSPKQRWLLGFGALLSEADDSALAMRAALNAVLHVEVEGRRVFEIPITRLFPEKWVDDSGATHEHFYNLWKWIVVPAAASLTFTISVYAPLPRAGVGLVLITHLATERAATETV